MKVLLFIFLCAQFFFAKIVGAQTLSTETQIKVYIGKQQLEQLSLLEKLVNINSGTANIAGVHQVGEILRPFFQQLGFKTYWVEEPSYMQRAGTLVAEHSGTKGKRILIIGHLDTVFAKDSPFQKFERHGDKATGPGVIDDKGGDVVILYALKSLQDVNVLSDMNITVVLTGDEEYSGKPTSISRKPLFTAAQHSDVALGFEWATLPNTATIARRGVDHWQINTQGSGVHSFEVFQKPAGYGAIFELTRILNTMREQMSAEKGLSFSPGLILAGASINYKKNYFGGEAYGKDNIIAKTAMATGDLRFITPEQEISAKKKIAKIINHHLPTTMAVFNFQEGIPCMPLTANNIELLKKYSEVSINLGYGPVIALDPGLRGAADISHVASITQANLDGLGPVGTGAHSENETLDIKSLPIQTQTAAVLMYRLAHDH
ncbi:M20/M25/M40 family metallo-hydrolase [Rickettsiella endosymbiont of Rhagonycha lignosa]|uniref:M20/M25/M40 family metallo-hydrolase n=1 Tax=Rickettsiella endosymbiont of Rhagonycha lignosa TaxID=3077937 RepID=UPI00313DABDA